MVAERSKYNGVIRARVPETLISRAQKIADRRVTSLSQMLRTGFLEQVEKHERELGLPVPVNHTEPPHYPHSAE